VADVAKGGKPYVWVTWVAGLLSGEDKCEFRLWYRSRYKYDKVQESADRKEFLAEWTKKHDAMTEARAAKMRGEGYVVKVEEPFTLEGALVKLAGKTDVVGMADDGSAIVYDQKSGSEKRKDAWQVILYLFALPLTWLKGYRLTGAVEYRDRIKPVHMPVDGPEKISKVMRLAALPDPPPHSPSAAECRYCDILSCTKRYTGEATDLF